MSNEEQERAMYWDIVFNIRNLIELSGRSKEDLFEELDEDIADD